MMHPQLECPARARVPVYYFDTGTNELPTYVLEINFPEIEIESTQPSPIGASLAFIIIPDNQVIECRGTVMAAAAAYESFFSRATPRARRPTEAG